MASSESEGVTVLGFMAFPQLSGSTSHVEDRVLSSRSNWN